MSIDQNVFTENSKSNEIKSDIEYIPISMPSDIKNKELVNQASEQKLAEQNLSMDLAMAGLPGDIDRRLPATNPLGPGDI